MNLQKQIYFDKIFRKAKNIFFATINVWHYNTNYLFDEKAVFGSHKCELNDYFGLCKAYHVGRNFFF